MLVLERILAIEDLDPDHVQCGISGDERAVLEKRGFVRVDGVKAKDYMVRTIQKTAKKDKAIIKGDKKLTEVLPEKPVARQMDKAIAGKVKKAIPLGASVKGGKVVKADGKRLKDKYFRETLQRRHSEIDVVKLKGKQGDVNVRVYEGSDKDDNMLTNKRKESGTNYPNGLTINKGSRNKYAVTHSETGWSLMEYGSKKEAERFVKSATKDNINFSGLDDKGTKLLQTAVNVHNKITGSDIIPPASKTTRPKKVKPPTDKKTIEITIGDRNVKIGNPANYRKISIDYHPVWGYSPVDSNGKSLTYTNERGKEITHSFSSKKKAESFAKSVELEVKKQFESRK